MRISVASVGLVVGLGLLAACQRIQEPTPTITQDQWRRIQDNVLEESELPTLSHPVNAVFGSHFELIGWDMADEEARAGEEVRITYYWRVLEPTPTQRWRIFVHLDSSMRQNLDHEAVMNAYPTTYWNAGEIIRDEVVATLNDRMADGEVKMYIGFFNEDDRLLVGRAGEGAVQDDGRLYIGSFTASSNPYEIRRWTGAFTLDGQLDESAWDRGEQTSMWGDANSGEAQALESWGKLLWDDQYLYVAMHSEDPDIWSTITARDGELWNEEVMELYVDGNSNGRDYLEFQINPLNTIFDAQFTDIRQPEWPIAAQFTLEGMESMVSIDGTVNERGDRDRSWTVEMRIPLASLPSLPNVPPQPQDLVRVNFYRYDRSGSENEASYFAWSPVGGGSWHQPDKFGEATFVGGPRSRPPRTARPNLAEGSGAVAPGLPSAPAPAEGSGSIVPN